MVEAGAGAYKGMCAHCHGGVGDSRAIWARTMRPIPPPLARVAPEWSAEEVFWIVKHGVKMSGMPAFGPTHEDQSLWEIAAFVKQLPEMSAAEYAAYEDSHGGEGHSHGGQESAGGGHGHGGEDAGSGHSH
nr:cytochrome c [Alteripontixanthobacter muriae]